MYAVVRTGGKQYKVSEGDLLKVEKLEGAVGDTVELGEVLMVGGELGRRLQQELHLAIELVLGHVQSLGADRLECTTE